MIFEDVKAFVVVAEQKSFSNAANYLSIAQSALSKRVQRLEEHTGFSLLERHARGVSLTEHGHALLDKAKYLVHEVEKLERNLINTDFSPSGEVVLAVPQRTANSLIPRVLKKCNDEYPLIKINVLEGNPTDIHIWAMQGESDISVVYSSEDYKGSNCQLILEEPLYLFSTPFFLDKYLGGIPDYVKIVDLEKIPLVLPKKPSPVRTLLEKLIFNRNLKIHISYEIDGTSSIRGMVESNLCATVFGPASTWHHLVEKGNLVAVPFASPSVKWKMYLFKNKKATQSMAINKVQKIVHDELLDMLEHGFWPSAKKE